MTPGGGVTPAPIRVASNAPVSPPTQPPSAVPAGNLPPIPPPLIQAPLGPQNPGDRPGAELYRRAIPPATTATTHGNRATIDHAADRGELTRNSRQRSN